MRNTPCEDAPQGRVEFRDALGHQHKGHLGTQDAMRHKSTLSSEKQIFKRPYVFPRGASGGDEDKQVGVAWDSVGQAVV